MPFKVGAGDDFPNDELRTGLLNMCGRGPARGAKAAVRAVVALLGTAAAKVTARLACYRVEATDPIAASLLHLMLRSWSGAHAGNVYCAEAFEAAHQPHSGGPALAKERGSWQAAGSRHCCHRHGHTPAARGP